MMKRLPDGHVGEEGLAPLGVFILGEAEAGSSKHELIIVVVEAERVQVKDSVIHQSEVHAGHRKALGSMSPSLVLS
jgi:hypothetical protein